MHTCIHPYIHTYCIPTYIHIQTNTQTCMRAYLNIHTHTNVCKHIYVRAFLQYLLRVVLGKRMEPVNTFPFFCFLHSWMLIMMKFMQRALVLNGIVVFVFTIVLVVGLLLPAWKATFDALECAYMRTAYKYADMRECIHACIPVRVCVGMYLPSPTFFKYSHTDRRWLSCVPCWCLQLKFMWPPTQVFMFSSWGLQAAV